MSFYHNFSLVKVNFLFSSFLSWPPLHVLLNINCLDSYYGFHSWLHSTKYNQNFNTFFAVVGDGGVVGAAVASRCDRMWVYAYVFVILVNAKHSCT